MHMCKTLRRVGRANGCASRRRRCAGRTNGRTDIRMSEWTDKRVSGPTARFIHIQMRALYDRANESENALAHLGLEFTARG